MAQITITYTAVNAPVVSAAADICAVFVPTNAAADLAAFDGTYYDTNVKGWGEGMSMEQFVKNSVAHPGLVLALKRAVADGTYEFETEDEKLVMYLEEVAPAVADQGFDIAVSKN